MRGDQKISAGGLLVLLLVVVNVFILEKALVNGSQWYGKLWITVPCFLAAVYLFLRNSRK